MNFHTVNLNTFSGKLESFLELRETQLASRGKWKIQEMGKWAIPLCSVLIRGRCVGYIWWSDHSHVLIYSLLLFVCNFLRKPTFHCIEIAALSLSLSLKHFVFPFFCSFFFVGKIWRSNGRLSVCPNLEVKLVLVEYFVVGMTRLL